MQHLSEKWLKIFNYYHVLFSIYFVVIFAYFAIDQKTIQIVKDNPLGANLASAIFASICIIYSLLILRFVKKYNIWLAYLISFLLILAATSFATEQTLKSSITYLYLINNYIMGLEAVIFGPIVALASMGIITIIFSMTIANSTTPTIFGKTGDTIIFITRILFIGLLTYLVRNKYEEDADKHNFVSQYFVNNKTVGLLTNSISDGVIIIDRNEIIKLANPEALKILNQKAKDILDLNYRSVLKLKTASGQIISAEEDPISKAMQSNNSFNNEFMLSSADNPELYIDLNVSVIFNDQTQEIYGAIIILRDVSNRKKEEETRSEFISTASHEMRTPVAAIEGYIELALNQKVSTIDANARKYLEKAKNSSQHLGSLFQDLLASAKAEDGRLSNHPIVFELGELLEQQAEMSKMVAQQKNLELEFVISSEQQTNKHKNIKTLKPLYYVIADPNRIREVANNLIDNAMKYTPSGKITIGITGDSDVVQFFIRDTGIGISKDNIGHLFQKFYRVDSSDTRVTGGTGLGLFISKEIIDLYHGNIWAESENNNGTTFFVNLPRLNNIQAEATLANQQREQETVLNNPR